MMFDSALYYQAEQLLALARAKEVMLVTAESCTGGLIAALLTEVPGSSDVVFGGMVVYANEAKQTWLSVPELLLAKHGAVSEPVACLLAEQSERAVFNRMQKRVMSVAVSGVAGPGGGTQEKPVGTVHIACAFTDASTRHQRHHFTGDRSDVRLQTVEAALVLMSQRLMR